MNIIHDWKNIFIIFVTKVYNFNDNSILIDNKHAKEKLCF